MKKIFIIFMALPLFSFTSATANFAELQDCDALAEDWYSQTLAGGYSQADATRVYLMVHEDCFMNGGDSAFTANP